MWIYERKRAKRDAIYNEGYRDGLAEARRRAQRKLEVKARREYERKLRNRR